MRRGNLEESSEAMRIHCLQEPEELQPVLWEVLNFDVSGVDMRGQIGSNMGWMCLSVKADLCESTGEVLRITLI